MCWISTRFPRLPKTEVPIYFLRVEIEIPDSDSLKNIQKTYGPFYVWVVLDGYMTRGVQ